MADDSRHDRWGAGGAYDNYMGRWSRVTAAAFLDWLALPDGLDWLDVGCGTGALSAAIVDGCDPRSLIGVDPSPGFVDAARLNVPDGRAEFRTGDAQSLELESLSRDAVVSGLCVNFVPDRVKALQEMTRVARAVGTVAFYVWDYPGGGLEFLHWFWQVATPLDPKAAELSEDRRFGYCTPDGLLELARQAGLPDAECAPIEITTRFSGFDDYWLPFTKGTGPAPGYCASLEPDARERLRDALGSVLPREADGSIALRARAWAVRATANPNL